MNTVPEISLETSKSGSAKKARSGRKFMQHIMNKPKPQWKLQLRMYNAHKNKKGVK